jgi:L-threonylcarbamoyladenylate synthase
VIIDYSDDSLQLVAETIARGGLIAFRTDTLYGLGVDPFNPDAIHKLKQLKGRDEGKPILIVISGRDQLARFIKEPSAAFNHLAQTFWPGPLTLIGKANESVPRDITAGTETIGVRLPDDENVRALVTACGGALTATSANPSTLAPARTAQTVDDYFGEAIDLIVDDGEAKTDRPSTVVDVSGSEAKLIREGVLAWNEIEKELARSGGSEQ